jgi:methionyl aminopeptidase
MINMGASEVRTLEDEWTIVTIDGSLSSHFEHTIAVTSGLPEILTTVKEKSTTN